ncbi:MAG TPA: NTF2 fold immunity protein [Burkholderiaceae bacterium]
MDITNIVSSEQMAAALAEVYVTYVYGAQAAQSQKPYRVQALPEAWQVEGQLPEAMLGGTFELRLARMDGRVLALSHSR